MLKQIKSQVKAIFNAKLPFEILEEFKGLKSEEVYQKGSFFKKLNEKVILIDLNTHIMGLVFASISLITFIFFFFTSEDIVEMYSSPGIYIYTFITIVFILSIVYFFWSPKKYIILDRERGMFTFPHRLIGKSYKTSFNKAIVFWTGSGGVTGNLDMHLVAQHPDKKIGGANLISHINNYRKTWSFYVWYMDRNRPLPPGSAFDPYREKDFQRRKAEGFPKPLYRSHIPTPEATSEQQAEREQYWKDQVEEFTREPNSVLYDPNIHIGWNKAVFKNERDDSAMKNIYYRYEFENGDVVYVKTDEQGFGYTPPKGMKYITKGIELYESWF